MAKLFTPKLSPRLEGIVSLVPKGLTVADVGCDHGYISIALVQREIAPSSVASDIKEGPLLQAKKNVEKAGLTGKIDTKLYPGIDGLEKGQAQVIVIAGMGQRTIADILSGNMEVAKSAKYLILQPQSEIPEMREFIRDNGFHLVKNIMMREGDKFYFAMLVSTENEDTASKSGIANRIKEKTNIPELDHYLDELDILFGLDLIYGDPEFAAYLRHVDSEWTQALERLGNAKKPDFEKITELTKKAEASRLALEMNMLLCRK